MPKAGLGCGKSFTDDRMREVETSCANKNGNRKRRYGRADNGMDGHELISCWAVTAGQCLA